MGYFPPFLRRSLNSLQILVREKRRDKADFTADLMLKVWLEVDFYWTFPIDPLPTQKFCNLGSNYYEFSHIKKRVLNTRYKSNKKRISRN